MIKPVRLKPSSRFVKSRKKVGEPIASRADKAIKKFYSSPGSPGLNFEELRGAPGYFTIRVNRNFRILMREEADGDGPYYLLLELAAHDETYEDF